MEEVAEVENSSPLLIILFSLLKISLFDLSVCPTESVKPTQLDFDLFKHGIKTVFLSAF